MLLKTTEPCARVVQEKIFFGGDETRKDDRIQDRGGVKYSNSARCIFRYTQGVYTRPENTQYLLRGLGDILWEEMCPGRT